MPGDVADKKLGIGIIGERVGQEHRDVRAVGRRLQVSSHAPVGKSLFRTRIVLNDKPFALHLQYQQIVADLGIVFMGHIKKKKKKNCLNSNFKKKIIQTIFPLHICVNINISQNILE